MMAEGWGKLRGSIPYIVVLSLGALGGLSLWYWGAPNAEFLRLQEENRSGRSAGRGAGAFEPTDATRTAERYAAAVRDGRCREVIALTQWMQERLEHARSGGGGALEEESVVKELCADMQQSSVEGNRLRAEGVEDRYVFAPMTRVTIVSVDSGRADLARPVRERVWMRVWYAVRTQALRDETGSAIKSLNVGLNISEENFVLKAGMVGNLEIDYDSLSYSW